MEYKETIKCGIWSEPDEKNRVHRLDMRTYQEVFDELKGKLEDTGLLPNDYFILKPSVDGENKIPNFLEAICSINFGGSEGIYLDIRLHYHDEENQAMSKGFATGKTLGETTADFYKMSLAAGECSMLLNGNGCKVQNNVKKVLILDETERFELANALGLQESVNKTIGRSNETVYSLMDSLKDDTPVPENEDEDDLEM